METWLSRVRPVLHEALRQRDAYTEAHCARVGALSLALGKLLDLSPDELVILGVAARLHDVGKIGIPDAIVGKPAELSAAEWEIMRTHSDRGARIVLADSSLPLGTEIALAIRHHHERFDGTGYPDRLQGQAIPLASRLLAVADSYDAMLEPRPYHAARTHQQVVEVLSQERGNKHDPQMVDLILSRDEDWLSRYRRVA